MKERKEVDICNCTHIEAYLIVVVLGGQVALI